VNIRLDQIETVYNYCSRAPVAVKLNAMTARKQRMREAGKRLATATNLRNANV
jgi:hypothetical protein